jgi:hypothetical protein
MHDPKLNTEDVDQLGQAILTLTEELWVLKDRQRVLEELLAQAGIVSPEALDRHAPDAELAARLATERQELISHVLGALRGSAD